MKVQLVVVGRVRGPLEAAIRDYEGRVARYWKFEVVEVDAGAPGGRDDPEAVRGAEGQRILARVGEAAQVVALTRDGRGLGSRALAQLMSEAALHARDLSFVIGGAFGLDDSVLARAWRRLSLSDMTLPHEVARLVLAEQLYRAGTILRGEPYHKGP